jgi:hypothetical protein
MNPFDRALAAWMARNFWNKPSHGKAPQHDPGQLVAADVAAVLPDLPDPLRPVVLKVSDDCDLTVRFQFRIFWGPDWDLLVREFLPLLRNRDVSQVREGQWSAALSFQDMFNILEHLSAAYDDLQGDNQKFNLGTMVRKHWSQFRIRPFIGHGEGFKDRFLLVDLLGSQAQNLVQEFSTKFKSDSPYYVEPTAFPHLVEVEPHEKKSVVFISGKEFCFSRGSGWVRMFGVRVNGYVDGNRDVCAGWPDWALHLPAYCHAVEELKLKDVGEVDHIPELYNPFSRFGRGFPGAVNVGLNCHLYQNYRYDQDAASKVGSWILDKLGGLVMDTPVAELAQFFYDIKGSWRNGVRSSRFAKYTGDWYWDKVVKNDWPVE